MAGDIPAEVLAKAREAVMRTNVVTDEETTNRIADAVATAVYAAARDAARREALEEAGQVAHDTYEAQPAAKADGAYEVARAVALLSTKRALRGRG